MVSRNSHLTSNRTNWYNQSLVADNVSGGLEPIFSVTYYDRTIQTFEGPKVGKS